MARLSSEPVKTFSIGFESDAFNELPYAARRRAVRHRSPRVRRCGREALEILPKLVRHYGEPFADSSAIPSFYLAEMTRRHVTVALNGDGGDESFAGYTRYVPNVLSRRLEGSRYRCGALATAGGSRLPAGGSTSRSERLRRLRASALDGGPATPPTCRYLDGLHRDQLYSDEYRRLVGESRRRR